MKYTQVNRAEELGNTLDELLYISKGIDKILDLDKKKLEQLKGEYSYGSNLLENVNIALNKLQNSRVGKNKLLVLLIAMAVIFVLWVL